MDNAQLLISGLANQPVIQQSVAKLLSDANMSGSFRQAILSLIMFFVAGCVILIWTDIAKAIHDEHVQIHPRMFVCVYRLGQLRAR